MNFFTQLGSSWVSSMKLLSPSPMKMFLLATLMAVRDIYYHLFVQSWWIIPLCVLLSMIAPLLGLAALIFMIVIAARTSVGIKNQRYFISMIPFFIIYSLIILLLVYSGNQLEPFIEKSTSFVHPFISILLRGKLAGFGIGHLEIFLLLVLFFFLDSGFWLTSIMNAPLNAVKIFLYNYPLFFVVSIALFLWQTTVIIIGGISLYVLHSMFGSWGKFLVSPFSLDSGSMWIWWVPLFLMTMLWIAIMMPLGIAVLYTLYVKRAYDQSQLYTYL